jgi:hypothetical protein
MAIRRSRCEGKARGSETQIPQAKRSGISKSNYPDFSRRALSPRQSHGFPRSARDKASLIKFGRKEIAK